jgi:hypothetical protein
MVPAFVIPNLLGLFFLIIFSNGFDSSINDQRQSVSGTPPASQYAGMPWKLPNDGLRVASGLVAEVSTHRWASDWPTSVGSWNLGTPIQVPHGNPQKMPAEHVN